MGDARAAFDGAYSFAIVDEAPHPDLQAVCAYLCATISDSHSTLRRPQVWHHLQPCSLALL